MSTPNKVRVCGADWCGDTRMTLKQLDKLGVPYTYVDIEQDAEAEQWVKDQNNGKLKRPTLDVDGLILVEPEQEELVAALTEKKLLPR